MSDQAGGDTPHGDRTHADEAVVDALCRGRAQAGGAWSPNVGRHPLPSRDAVIDVVNGLRAVLFPRYFGEADLAVRVAVVPPNRSVNPCQTHAVACADPP